MPVRGTVISCIHASGVSGFLRKRSAGSALRCISGGEHEHSSVHQKRQDTHGASVAGDEDHLLLTERPHISQHLPCFFFRQHERNEGRHRRALAAVL